ncbi:hypothetical protein [Streptomyces sp. NPDC102462]
MTTTHERELTSGVPIPLVGFGSIRIDDADMEYLRGLDRGPGLA